MAVVRRVLPFLVLTSFAGVVFFPQVRHPFDLMVGTHYGGQNDLSRSFFAYRSLPRWELMRSGRLPFWNPYSQCGTPAYSNPESGWFYPPNWVMLVYDAVPTLSWLLVLHHVWGGLGTYFLCRRWCSPMASLFAGCLYLGAPYWVAHTAEGHFSQACTVSWIPWVFLAFEYLLDGRRGGVLLMSGTLAITFFAGHVQELYYSVLLLCGFLGVEACRKYRTSGLKGAVTIACRWVLSCALMGGLIAAQFLPNWGHAMMAGRAQGISLERSGGGLTLHHLWQLLYPFALGAPGTTVDADTMPFYWETLCYFGVAPLLLVVIGLIAGKARSAIVRYGLAALFCFLFAFGASSPLFRLMYEFVPGVSSFREASRVFFLLALAVAVLAGQGVDWLLTVRPPRVSSNFRWRFAYVLMAISLIEFAVHSNSLFGTVPKENLRMHSDIVEFLERELTGGRVFAVQELLSDREAWASGIETILGYNPVGIMSYAIIFSALVDDYDDPMGFAVFDVSNLDPELCDLMNLKYIVAYGRPRTLPEGWRIVQQGRVPRLNQLRGTSRKELAYTVIENPSALPRAFVVGTSRVMDAGGDATDALRSLNPRAEVLLLEDVLPPGKRASFAPAEVVEYEPNRVAIRATLDAPGYLVLSDAWCPGWKADVGGQPVDVVRANVALRAVPLPAGTHEVVFRYRPWLLGPGSIISVVASVIWIVLLFSTVKADVRGRFQRLIKSEPTSRATSEEQVGTGFAEV